jgi:nitroimidazol reductase NimA-like FMN-containing flavoprotein (pyridoxamine 5'-phosphate oxidase superfamily)
MQYRMKRFQLTQKQIAELLQKADIGRFSSISEDGYPYTIAMHFVYYKDKIFMHGLPKGQKIDNIKKNPKTCFEVDELFGLVPGIKNACDTEAVYNSVVVTGISTLVINVSDKKEVLGQLIDKYTPQFSKMEIPENMLKGTAVIELNIEQCTGKYHK